MAIGHSLMIYTSVDVVAYLPWYLGPVEELALSFVVVLYALVTTFTFAAVDNAPPAAVGRHCVSWT